jgi:hypothetical protein
MKRHYEIMRIMRTKVLDTRELWFSLDSILFVQDAIKHRVNNLISMSAALCSAALHAGLTNAARYRFSEKNRP